MQYRKTYKIRAAMGDGRPVDDTITAKNGTEAHDLARVKHPAARAIYVLGLAEEQLAMDHPFFSKEEEIEPFTIFKAEESERDRKIRWCVELRNQGKSHRSIAGVIGVGATTVRSWLKQYG